MDSTNKYKAEVERGEQFFLSGSIDEALGIFESVLEKDPTNAMALNDKGVALNNQGRYQEAIETFREVLQKDESNSNAVFNLISNFLALGKWNEVEKILIKNGHCLLQNDIEMIREDLKRIKGDTNESSINHPLENNNRFDYHQIQNSINTVLNKNLFFIIGIPKSGTTWTQNILNGHPYIRCMAESNLKWLLESFHKLASQYNSGVIEMNEGIGQNVPYATFTEDNINVLYITAVSLLFNNLFGESDIKCIGTKNPNVLTTIQITHELLPRAKFIHIIRDGRDVLTSGWFHNLRLASRTLKEQYPDFQNYVRAHAGKWSLDVQKARSFGRMHADSYLEVLYEDLHSNDDTCIKQMLDFLKVDSSKEMIGYCREGGSFKKLSQGRQRGQEDRKSFFRKGIVGDWRNLFDQSSLDIFMESAGGLIHDLGYE